MPALLPSSHFSGSSQYCRSRYQNRPRIHARKPVAVASPQQLSICTNKTCKKQGSVQIAKFVEDLGLEGLTVQRTSCLAKCGNGPNLVVSPLNVTLSHINTVAKMTEVLKTVAGYELPDSLLMATKLRVDGNGEARLGRLETAAELYTRALELDPPFGKHLLLSNRSGVLLSLGRAAEAARDADEASAVAPSGFKNSFIRQVEAHTAMNNIAAASKALDMAVERDSGFEQTEEYKLLRKQLLQALPPLGTE